MGDSRAPCRVCKFPGLCHALDSLRAENAALRAERYRRGDGPPIASAPIPKDPARERSAVRELRRELRTAGATNAELEKKIRELENALTHSRAVADAEHRRADAAQDALRRAYRVSLDVGGHVRRA